MINFNLNIDLFPDVEWKQIFWKSEKIPLISHKYYEIDCFKYRVLIGCFININFHKNHGGIEVGLGLLGHALNIVIYDSRHWNSETNTWEG